MTVEKIAAENLDPENLDDKGNVFNSLFENSVAENEFMAHFRYDIVNLVSYQLFYISYI